MSHGATQVDKSAFGQKNDVVAVLQGESVDLGLDVGLLGSIVLQPLDVNLTVEVTNVADNCVVFHPVKRQSSMNLANGRN
jgi:hypothetical protein